MPVRVRYYTDPGCSWSWGLEPTVRRLMVVFGDELSWTYVMGGLARDYGARDDPRGEGRERVYSWLVGHWLDVADETDMPMDPRLWREAPIRSTYPACMAVKAASEQGPERASAYLRVLREGLCCFRRKLDTTEALVEQAREAGLDVARFRVDLASNAIVEAFGADLEEVRDVPDEAAADVGGTAPAEGGGRRLSFPSLVFSGEGGEREAVYGFKPYDAYSRAAEAAGAAAQRPEPPGAVEALGRFGRMATAEVAAVCALPGPRAPAELWRLASDWHERPVRVLTGHLWEPA